MMDLAWKTVRVFISSTFRDMQAERDHLVRFVFPRLREKLLARRIHLVDVDLRWGVTGGEDASEVCREVIGECRPRFLCILGGRYGYVPDKAKKSITADEIDFGVLNPPANDHGPVRAFFYFRHESATDRMVEEEPGDFRESEGSPAWDKLLLLKQSIVAAGHEPRIYGEDAQWDAALKRLVGLTKFGDSVHDDLLQSIKADSKLAERFAATAAPPDEFADENDAMESFIEERTERFIPGSRQQLLNSLATFATTDGAQNILVLTGAPGSGKSALLARLVRDLEGKATVIPHFIGASAGSTDLRRTLRRLCHALARATGNTEPLPLDIKELIAHFQKLATGVTQRTVFVFDALNQLDTTDGAHWLNWLPREIPPLVCIITSVIAPPAGQPEHQTLAILRVRPGSRIEPLGPLDESDAYAIIESYRERYKKRLSPGQIAALLDEKKPERFLPLYLLTALEELRTLGTDEHITALAPDLFPHAELERIRRDDHDKILAAFIEKKLPGTALELFRWILTKRLGTEPILATHPHGGSAGLVERFAACLGVSRHGLSPAELTALLDPGDPLGNVAALLRLLRPYLMRRGELLDFYHGQFREAAVAAHLDTSDKQRAAHQSVANCLQAFADPHRDGLCRAATPHALSELPHHQSCAEAWPDLIATLENIFFLEAKVTHGMAFNLAEDFTVAVESLPLEHTERQRLRLLDEALRRDIHFIARHASDYPQALFQCLWNSAWWYDCPDASRHYVSTKTCWSIVAKPIGWFKALQQHCRFLKGRKPLTQEGKLHPLLESWRSAKETQLHAYCWVRSLRPPPVRLGEAKHLTLRGHEGEVNCVCFSPDGKRIASGSGSRDNTVRVWDAQTGAEIGVLHGHEGAVLSVCFSPDGRRLLSGSDDKTARVWDIERGIQLTMLRGNDGVRSVCYSPNGQHLLTGSQWIVTVWDSHTETVIANLCGHNAVVTSVCYSPDGKRIISASEDRTVRVWDVRSGDEIAIMHGHYSPVLCVSCSPDGKRIVSASMDATLRLWDAETGESLAVFRGPPWNPQRWFTRSVSYASDGRRIVGATPDHVVRVWDAETGVELAAFGGHEWTVMSVSFSADGQHIVSGSYDLTARVWEVDSCVETTVLCGHTDTVNSVRLLADGQRIVSESADRTARVWDIHNGAELAVFRGHRDQPVHWRYSPDGRHIVSIAAWDKALRGWDAQLEMRPTVMRGHEDYVTEVAFSPDGVWVVSGSEDTTVRLWDLRSGASLAVMRGHERAVRCVGFSPDGRLIVSGSDDWTVRVWDAQLGTALAVFRGHKFVVSHVRFSADGQRIVSEDSQYVRVWNTESRELIEESRRPATIDEIDEHIVRSPFHAAVVGPETVIKERDGDKLVAHFSAPLLHITIQPIGHALAGATGTPLYIIRLEHNTKTDQSEQWMSSR